jgi:hypothetical protein
MSPPSRPGIPEANRALEEHELARRFESEKARVNGVFAGIARQHEADRNVDVAWRRDQDLATLLIARACGVEEQLPRDIVKRATEVETKATAALPAIGKDARQTRFYALLGFGAALIELAIRLLDHFDHPGISHR